MRCGQLTAPAKGYDMRSLGGAHQSQLCVPSASDLAKSCGRGLVLRVAAQSTLSRFLRVGVSGNHRHCSVVGRTRHAHQRFVVGRVRSDLDRKDTGSQERVSPPGPQEAAYAYEHTDSAW